MGGDFAAELLKLRKRPSTWVLATLLFLGVLLLCYVTVYAFVAAAPVQPSGVATGSSTTEGRASSTLGPAADREKILGDLSLENLVPNLLPTSTGLGRTLALLLGVLVVGGEYGWGTLKTVLIQRSGRGGMLAGKLLVLGAAVVGLVLLIFAAGVVGSLGVGWVEGSVAGWPPIGEVVGGAAAMWLILAVWAMLGVFLAVLFRGTALAVGIGLAYVLVLETAIASFPAESGALSQARRMLPGESSDSLANSFGLAAQRDFAGSTPLDATHAVLLLTFYLVAFSVLAAVLALTRDVDD